MTTNPNGANQYTMDPRQRICWDSYINPKSETFSNGYRSALKAGYSEGYAQSITDETWFTEKLRRLNMLSKAEKVLDETLGITHINLEGKVDSSVLGIKNKTAMFVSERLGKDEGWASRKELTGKDGEKLFENLKDVPDEELANIAYGSETGVSETGTGEEAPA